MTLPLPDSSSLDPLPVRYLLIICSLSIDYIPEFQHFTHGVQVMTCQLLSFNFNFATQQQKQQQSGKVAISALLILTIESSAALALSRRLSTCCELC